MPTTARNPEDSAVVSEDKPHASTDQPTVAHITEQLSESSVSTDVAFVAELDSTPIASKNGSVIPSSTPSKAPISDVTVDDANRENYKMLAGEKPVAAHILEQVAKAKAAKIKDPAVLINLPTSPSAQAYEVVQDTKNPGDEGCFDPAYADTDNHNGSAKDDNAS